ncbi:MAG: energy-coupling factor transporter ATPase [Candidatus Enteromonas sp.]|nr:energy-coupling factor transporter ATPase [Candidatus Enteromonas sp.]
MNEPILQVENLSYAYEEGQNVLNGVSFSVNQGSYVCVIGHNGSGKSTLAKCIIGLMAGVHGNISLFGQPLNKKSVYSLRSRVGIVFQNPDNQFVGSTVADDIAFGLENRRIPSEEMDGIIRRFAEEAGMGEFLNHEPQMLSGGQKQRVAIAGVLAMNPDLIIFDEATSMLDPKGKREISALVSKMRKDNPSLTLLSITHDVEEAAEADQVIVLEEGKVLFSGTPNEVFANEDALRSIHLGVPFVYALKARLKERGIDVPLEITKIEELEDYLCR